MSSTGSTRRILAVSVATVLVAGAVVLALRPDSAPVAAVTAVAQPTPTPTPTPTPEPSPTPSPSPSPTPSPTTTPTPTPMPVPEPTWTSVLDPAGQPERVVIPAIEVDATLVELGLNPDRSMEVPDFGLAGWYTEGPAPGHPGPSVIAAHVDSRAGPDVFARLSDLRVDDLVHVVYDSGETVTFEVDTHEQVPKDHLPGDRIWPVTDQRRLTLITCGGEFDHSVRHYRDNLIVYTRPVSA